MYDYLIIFLLEVDDDHRIDQHQNVLFYKAQFRVK